MYRHYFQSSELNKLSEFEMMLERQGIARDRIHVVSDSTASEQPGFGLNTIADLLARDVVRQGLMGMLVGLVLAAGLLLLALSQAWFETPTGATLVVLGSLLLMGFCTWQGGYIGIRKLNGQFKAFQQDLDAGKHIMYVEMDSPSRRILDDTLSDCAGIEAAGIDKGRPRWTLIGQRRLTALLTEQLP